MLIFNLVSVMLFMSLNALPLAAQTVEIGGDIAPNSVICLNNSTGHSIVQEEVSAVGGVADCSTLPKSQGDALSIIVSGIAGGSPDSCDLIQEPPNTDLMEVGTLAHDECVTIEAQIDRPFDRDDNTTFDLFNVALTSPTNLSLTLEPVDDAQWALA